MPAINFQARFACAVKSGAKREMIHERKNDWSMPARPGQTLTLCADMGTENSRFLMSAVCWSVTPVEIKENEAVAFYSTLSSPDDLEAFARDDGFETWADLVEFFKKTHGLPFVGWLIRW